MESNRRMYAGSVRRLLGRDSCLFLIQDMEQCECESMCVLPTSIVVMVPWDPVRSPV